MDIASTKNPVRKTFHARALGAALLGSLSMCAAAAPTYAVTDLGVLPGCNVSIPYNLNDRGDVVGYCTSLNGGPEIGFVWRGGVMSPVGVLPGGVNSVATGIDSSGKVVGEGDSNHNVTPQGFVSTPTGLANFFPVSGNVFPFYLGDSGFIGGRYTKGNNSPFIPAIWTVDPKDPRKYRVTNLNGLPTATNTSAFAQVSVFNQLGQAAGYSNDPSGGGAVAVVWNNDAAHTVVRLGSLPIPDYLNGAPDCCNGVASGINDLGVAVGEKTRPSHGSDAVLWANDAAHTATVLPPLPGDTYGSAIAINNAGQVLGWSAYQAAFTNDHTPFRMVVWVDGQPYDLQSLLDPVTGAGIVFTTSTLTLATQEFPIKINGAGQLMVTGSNNGSPRHALLLTPIAQ